MISPVIESGKTKKKIGMSTGKSSPDHVFPVLAVVGTLG
jgi:hypothetical protein